jgi:PKD domain-containing protein/matrixin
VTRTVVCAVLAALALPATAGAFKIDKRIVPQPKVRYYVGLDDWKKPMDRVVRALNRAKVGVKLVKAEIPEQASVQVGRLEQRCGYPGVSATTQTLVGGYAAIYLPYDCKGAQASIIAAHELGHALGLKHEDRRCALMNSSGTGPQSVPTECLGRRLPWRSKPWRPDDLAGLKRLYRDTAPTVTLDLTGPSTVAAGTPVTFKLTARDKERNLSLVRVDYGDGTREERGASEPPPSSHTYLTPGTYRITATALDYYRKRASASVNVRVTAA